MQKRLLNIDLMRTLAVVSVLVFHANEELLPGGFLGVDIFYVISGFVVSKSLMENYSGYLNFLLRRFFRLAPAAAVTIVATLLILGATGYDILGEKHYISSIAASLFYSNIYFAFDTSYFDPIMQGNPFLHFWSLNVEEQFYFVWPVFCFAFLRMRFVYIAVLCIVFFVCSFVMWSIYPYISFFLMPYRIAQFSSGAILYVSWRNGFIRLPDWCKLEFIFPTLLVLFAGYMWFVNGETHWTGVFLIPTIASAIIIGFALNTNFSVNGLVARFFLFIGQASYSIYLVHWPLTVFFHLKYGINWQSVGIIIPLSIILGAVLHTYVEKSIKCSRSGVLTFFGRDTQGKTNFRRGNRRWVFVSGAAMFIPPLIAIRSLIPPEPAYDTGPQIAAAQAELERLLNAGSSSEKSDVVAGLNPSIILRSDAMGNGPTDVSVLDVDTLSHQLNPSSENPPVESRRTQQIENYVRFALSVNSGSTAQKRLSNECDIRPYSHAHGKDVAMFVDIDWEKCVDGEPLLISDSTGNAAAYFTRSVFSRQRQIGMISGQGCNLDSQFSDCSQLNSLRFDRLKELNEIGGRKVFIATREYGEIALSLPSEFPNISFYYFTRLPSYDGKVKDIVKIDPQSQFDMRPHLTDEAEVETEKLKLLSEENSNVTLIYWSPLDYEQSAPLNITSDSGDLIMDDEYHLNQQGWELLVKNYFKNNCNIESWENICDLPYQ